MEDRRTAIAMLLCMFIFMFWFEWVMAPYKPHPAAVPTPGAVQPAQLTPGAAPAGTFAPAVLNPQSAPALVAAVQKNPTRAELAKSPQTLIETKDYVATINHLGGRLTSFLLKNYKSELGSDELLNLVTAKDGGAMPLALYAGTASDAYVAYTLAETTLPIADGRVAVADGQDVFLVFKGQLDGTEIVKKIKFTGGSYLMALDGSLSKPSPAVSLEWSRLDDSLSDNQHINHNFITVLSQNKLRMIQLPEITTPVVDLGPASWTSLGDKYFMAALITGGEPKLFRIVKDERTYHSRMQDSASGASAVIYAGPKSHNELVQAGYQLERSVDLGWFAFIAHPLLALLRLFNSWFNNFGLAIVLLTLVIKTLFFPLTRTSFKSMKGMQALQPEMKALRERITDPNQLNKEMMGLYKKHNVNPMGGCFPILIQLPVFLGLYNALNYSIELRHAPFALWINDLSSPERLEFAGIGIPVMVLLMGVSMLVQQITTPSAMDPQQKKMMLLIPIIFTFSFVVFPFPSGLVLYWFINNIISIVQQVQLRSEKDPNPWQGTLIASVVIFTGSYLLTLI